MLSRDAVRRLRDSDALILVGLFIWLAVGLAVALRPMLRSGGIFTGVTTANPDDSFQYLSWVRDSGLHGLIGDNFQIGPSHYDFLQPMFLISGLLWRLGANLAISYLVWAPVALVFTWWSFRKLVRHHLTGWSASTALILGLSYMTPISLLAVVDGNHTLAQVVPVGSEMSTVTAAWGYLPRMIAVACLPILLLALEALLDDERRVARRVSAPVLVAAGAAGLASWLHPWQGAIALFTIAGIAVWSRPSWRRMRLLAVPAVAAALPLIYYAALKHFDPNWASGAGQNTSPTYSWLALAVCILPLAALALLGARRSLATSMRRRLLLLWLAASAVGYFATTEYSIHMLNGATLPLGILAVEGFHSPRGKLIRSRLSPRRMRTGVLAAIGVVVLGLSTVPGLYLAAQSVWFAGSTEASGTMFTSNDGRALSYLEHARTAGGVLASPSIASAVPGLTGRNVWAGHFVWTPGFVPKMETSYSIFTRVNNSTWTRDMVEATGARFVLIDCFTNHGSGLVAGTSSEQRLLVALRADTVAHRDFGCAAVLQLKGARNPA